MKKKKNYKEEIRVLIVLIIVAFTIKTSVAEIYVVPTPSMEDTIMVGDMLFGNKFIYGMKTPTWIGVPYTRMGFDIPWFRLPAFKKIKVDDVVIFEYPRDPFQKYVKRCVGVAGDSVRISLGNVYVNNEKIIFSDKGNFSRKMVKPRKPQELFRIPIKEDRVQVLSFLDYNPLYGEFRKEGEPFIDIPNEKYDFGEEYEDINNNGKYDFEEEYKDRKNALYDQGEEYTDINNNGRYDFGHNQNNISAFQVPYRGMEIDLRKVENWESMITLLVLDEADVQVKINTREKDELFKFTNIDPEEISRTRGFLKYKIQSFYSDVGNKQIKDAREYVQKAFKDYVKEKKINPWYWRRNVGFNEVLSKLYADDSIIMKNILINGKSLNELESYTLQHDYYFMMGDNRDNSYDSRFWGFVPDYHVLGTPIFSVLNLNFSKNINMIKPWTYINIFKFGMVN